MKIKTQILLIVTVLVAFIAAPAYADEPCTLPEWRCPKGSVPTDTTASKPKSCAKVFTYAKYRDNMIAYNNLNDTEVKELMVKKGLVVDLGNNDIVMEVISSSAGLGNGLILVRTPDGIEAIAGNSIPTGCN